jgi:transcription antitermination factor NusG
MSLTNGASNWYAFRVRSRHEKLVSTLLRGKGYKEFLPISKEKHRWVDRSKSVDVPLFPGYIFCDTEETEIGKIRRTQGIIDVIRAGSSPLPANRCEIDGLLQAAQADLSMESWPYLDPSTTGRVCVTSGPLSGLDGVLVEIRGKERLILAVGLLQRSVLIELPLTSVTLSAKPVVSVSHPGRSRGDHPRSTDIPTPRVLPRAKGE